VTACVCTGYGRVLPNVRWLRVRVRVPAPVPSRLEPGCGAAVVLGIMGPALGGARSIMDDMPCRRQAKDDRRTWVQTPSNAQVGLRLPSRSRPSVIRPTGPGCSRCGLGESHLVSVAPLFARMAPAMPTPCRNGCGSREKEGEDARQARPLWPGGAASGMQEPVRACNSHACARGARLLQAAKPLIARPRKRAVLL
jgi:hypothetical protein